ncbi:hypothetical protein DBR06_SOUSAS2010034, partial [Sousa chinensis]
SLFKAILLEHGHLGKSSLTNRHITQTSDTQASHTMGAGFLKKDLGVNG